MAVRYVNALDAYLLPAPTITPCRILWAPPPAIARYGVGAPASVHQAELIG